MRRATEDDEQICSEENVLLILAIMSPRYESSQAICFDSSYDANEPLIAAGDVSYEANEPLIAAGDADEGEEDHRLEEKTFSRFKFSALLLGFLVGFFIQFSILETNLLVITLYSENLVTKSKRNIVVFSLLWSFFTAAMVIASLRFLRNLVTITYSAAGGRSRDLLEVTVFHMKYFFGVGHCLAWTIWGMRAQTEYALAILVVALFWYKIEVMCFATDSNPSSSRRSTAEETMTAV
jgi:hypothetical protein